MTFKKKCCPFCRAYYAVSRGRSNRIGDAVQGWCNLAQGLYPVRVRDELNSSVSIFEHPGPSWKKIRLVDQSTTTDRICIGQSKIVICNYKLVIVVEPIPLNSGSVTNRPGSENHFTCLHIHMCPRVSPLGEIEFHVHLISIFIRIYIHHNRCIFLLSIPPILIEP